VDEDRAFWLATLLRENLKRSGEQRLRDLMRLQRFAEEWRRAARQAFD
jgi:hypothetical protein